MAACSPATGTIGSSIWFPAQRSSAATNCGATRFAWRPATFGWTLPHPIPSSGGSAALAGVEKALEDTDQQRLVRETARLVHIGADPADAVAVAVAWLAERLEFGTTHAIAGAPDWLLLSEQPGIGRCAEDCRGGRNPRPHGGRCPHRTPLSVSARGDGLERDGVSRRDRSRGCARRLCHAAGGPCGTTAPWPICCRRWRPQR